MKTDFLMILVTISGFIGTIYSFQKSRKDLKIQNIIKLKEIHNNFDDINAKLLPGGEWQNDNSLFENISINDLSRLNSYLGSFEIAKLMIESKSLSIKEFKVFFGYKLNNIFENTQIKGYIYDDEDSWKNLIELYIKYYKL